MTSADKGGGVGGGVRIYYFHNPGKYGLGQLRFSCKHFPHYYVNGSVAGLKLLYF
jgi:hypothetical protein